MTRLEKLSNKLKAQQVRQEIERITQRYPGNYLVYRNSISLLMKRGYWSDSAQIIEALIRTSRTGKLDRHLSREELASWYFTFGIICQKIREMGKAQRAYENALRLVPDNPHLMNALAYFYAEQGIALQKALKLARRAVELAPRSAEIVDTLGWVEYKLGRYQSAVRILQRAVRLMPDDATLRYHLGAAYAKVGQIDRARIELRKALILEPGNSDSLTLLNHLHNTTPDMSDT
ncbi:MAG: tetratricopeptide repeat protein [Armatimonadota bacterium]